MGQKTNPIGNRLGIIRGWESNWYGGNDYGDKLAEDQKLRNYVFARLSKASVSRVIIERTSKYKMIKILILGGDGMIENVRHYVEDKSQTSCQANERHYHRHKIT